jgi:hypothetical protein
MSFTCALSRSVEDRPELKKLLEVTIQPSILRFTNTPRAHCTLQSRPSVDGLANSLINDRGQLVQGKVRCPPNGGGVNWRRK